MCNDKCVCKEKYGDELNRLEVLEDLVDFAKKQKAVGSSHTDGWADSTAITKWQEVIGNLRTVLPKCAVEGFDRERRQRQHRPNCQCVVCIG